MSVSFEPASVGKRRRLPDRAALVVALAVAFVALAVAKPWSSGLPAEAAASPAPSGQASPASPAAIAPSSPPAAEALLAALAPHDAWGVRVLSAPRPTDRPGDIIRLADGTSIAEQWTDVRPVSIPLDAPSAFGGPLAGSDRLPRVVADASGAIRFLALTSPSRDPAIDVRVARIGADATDARWLDVRLPLGDLGLGEWLLPPPWIAGRELDQWPAGTYRIDVLGAGPIKRLTVEVPADGRRPMSVPDAPALHIADPEAGGGWPPGPGPGPVGFVIADGQAIALPGRLGPPLDERGAWLAAATSAQDPDPAIVHGWVPSATGVGLRFPAKARSISARLVRIAPSYAASVGGLRTGSVRTSDGDAPWAVVDAPLGATLPPGTYRLDVGWRDGTGRTSLGSIHLELAPGPPGILPRWLSAARGMAQWAGRGGFVVGLSGGIEGSATDGLTRLLPEAPRSMPTTAEALGATCADAVVAEAGDAVLGLVHDARAGALDVRVDRLVEDGAARPVLVRVSPEVVPGLVLIAPDGPWQPGRYAVTLSAGAGRSETSAICLGSGRPLRVPPP